MASPVAQVTTTSVHKVLTIPASTLYNVGVRSDVFSTPGGGLEAIAAGAPYTDGLGNFGAAGAFLHMGATFATNYVLPGSDTYEQKVPLLGTWVVTPSTGVERYWTWAYVDRWDGVYDFQYDRTTSAWPAGFRGYLGEHPLGAWGPAVLEQFTCTYTAVGPYAKVQLWNRTSDDLTVWLNPSPYRGAEQSSSLPSGPDIVDELIDWGDGLVQRPIDVKNTFVPGIRDEQNNVVYGYQHLYAEPGTYHVTFTVVCRDPDFNTVAKLTLKIGDGTTPTPTPDPPPTPNPTPKPVPEIGPDPDPPPLLAGVMGAPHVWNRVI